jgi:hypothetical protein
MQLSFLQPRPAEEERQPLQVRVPFLRQSIGLGDAVANLTQAAGIQPCDPCKQRQQALNRRVQLNPYRG